MYCVRFVVKEPAAVKAEAGDTARVYCGRFFLKEEAEAEAEEAEEEAEVRGERFFAVGGRRALWFRGASLCRARSRVGTVR